MGKPSKCLLMMPGASAAVQTQASTESVAQEATARQTLDENAPEAEKAKAPNLGIGKDKQRLAADWGRQISAYFELHKRYPKVKKGKSTTVKVSLVLNRLGNVVSVDVQESSGDAAFDEVLLFGRDARPQTWSAGVLTATVQ